MSFDSNHKVIQLDGGLGRVICAEPAVRRLAEKNRVTVITNWPDVFAFSPYLYKLYRMDREYLFDDVISKGDFIFPEPYHSSHYYTQRHHLVESFNWLINGAGKDWGIEHPCLYLQRDELGRAREAISQMRGALDLKIIAFQPFGSTAQFEPNRVFDRSFRSLSLEAAFFLMNALPDRLFLNCSHIELNHPRAINVKMTTRELFAAVDCCDAILGIDSSLMHIGYALQKRGVTILGPTFRENVGYANHFSVIQREDYPKSYQPNRISGGIELNQDAMNFTEQELRAIVSEMEKLI